MNINNNRNYRSGIALETLDILEQGYYVSPSGIRIDIREQVRKAVASSTLYRPSDLPDIRKQVSQMIESRINNFPVITANLVLVCIRTI